MVAKPLTAAALHAWPPPGWLTGERTIEPDRQAAMPRVAAAAADRLVALMRLLDLCARDQTNEDNNNNNNASIAHLLLCAYFAIPPDPFRRLAIA